MAQLDSTTVFGDLKVNNDLNVSDAITLSSAGLVTATSFTGAGTGLTGTASSLSIGGTATLATDIAAGSAGQIMYQTGSNATSFLAAGASGYYLKSNGTSAPSWVTAPGVSWAAGVTDNGIVSGNSSSQLVSESTLTYNGIDLLSTASYTGQRRLDVLNTNTTGTTVRAAIGVKTTSGGGTTLYGYGNANTETLLSESMTDAALIYGESSSSKLMIVAGAGPIKFFSPTGSGYVFNENGLDNDFRVESNSYSHNIYMDGATGKINLGENSSATVYKMANIISSNTDTNTLTNVGCSTLDDDNLLIWNAYNGGTGTASAIYANIDFATGTALNSNSYSTARLCYKGYGNATSTTGNYFSMIMYNGGMKEQFRFTRLGALHAENDIIAYSNTIGSDIRLKKNIETAPENSLEKIMKTRAVTFDWISENRQRDTKTTGYIAQELEEIFPELILEVEPLDDGSGDETKYKHIRYNELIPHLSNAMQ